MWSSGEAGGVRGVGGVQGGGALGADLDGGSVVDRGGCVKADPGLSIPKNRGGMDYEE